MMVINQNSKGKVHGIISNLVIVSVDGPIIQNEICYIIKEDIPLMAEVIKTSGQMCIRDSLKTTQIYAKIIDEKKREAVNKIPDITYE